MKKISTCLFIFLSVITVDLVAQFSYQQRVEDSVLYWYTKMTPDAKLKPFPSKGRVLTIKQQQNLNRIIEWMQASYTPVGGLGTFKQMIYVGQQGFNPHQYGVDFRVWNVGLDKSELDAQGHFKPIDEEYTRFDVNINAIPGSYPVYFVNDNKQYLFTWPPDGYMRGNKSEDLLDHRDPRIHPNVYPFITHLNELQTVFLAPDNKLPVIAVSIGEYLDLAEKGFERELSTQKEKIDAQWQEPKSRAEAYAYYVENSYNRFKNTVKKLRDQYKNRLNDQAILRDMQPIAENFHGDIDPFFIEAYPKSVKQFYPLYKIDPVIFEKCATDQPQWISISFPYKNKEDGNQLYELYKSVTEHFNYEYAYNYFFKPEKINGQPYKPANENARQERLLAYQKKAYWKKTIANPPVNLSGNMIFYDDFSGDKVGMRPSGWFFTTYGKHSRVANIKNLPGNWVQLGYGNVIKSTEMKNPLPTDFTLEYDIATDAFESRTGGAVELYLSTYPIRKDGEEGSSNAGSKLTLNIIAGNEADYNNNNYMGTAKLELHSTPSVNTENYVEGIAATVPLKEFTNRKNKLNVKLSIIGGNIQLFLNNNLAAQSSGMKMTYGKPCINCTLPVGTRFNIVSWKNTTNDADRVGVYISNIKISKN